jgi:phospholipase C
MTYSVEHLYVDLTGYSGIVTVDGVKRAEYRESGELTIRHPGFVNIFARASYFIQLKAGQSPGPGPRLSGTLPPPQRVDIPLTTTIFTPEGEVFTRDRVAIADLEQFRNLQEVSQEAWSFETHGISDPIPITDEDGWVRSGDAHLRIAVEETVTSKSAGLLVSSGGGTALKHIYRFDLFRVGWFVAKVTLHDQSISPSARLQLADPDGVVVTSSQGLLDHFVTLRQLDKSRDAAGHVRPWSLTYETVDPNLGESVTATVIASARIPLSILQTRIDLLLGAGGSKISVYGEDKGGRALARLEILDDFTAETVDMQGLLDGLLKKVAQDPGVDIGDIRKGVVYSVANRKSDFSYGLSLSVGGMKLTGLAINLGPSVHLQPSMPALRVDVAVEGHILLYIGDFPLASIGLTDNRLSFEIGLGLDAGGSIVLESWIDEDPIDIDISWADAVALGLVSIGLEELTGSISDYANDKIVNGFVSLIEQVVLGAPKIMALLLGGDYTLQSIGIERDTLAIDYLAPVEPDPKPSIDYMGIIGRSVTQLGPDIWQVVPSSLGDTWAADNLGKIDHVVVVMMENRSFDHLLGYREFSPVAAGPEGQQIGLVDYLYEQGFRVMPLKNSGIVPNAAGLKTRFPSQVGHRIADVAKQLSGQLQTNTGIVLNSPQGFLDDFAGRETGGLVNDDVLGTYDGDDLPFYRFLADNYSYCTRYFSAHPGPTLPNRMFALAGDLQRDRTGEAIVDNSNADNLALSRAPCIFDVLSRKGVGWRMYESFPSVTMLRMFARYVGNDTDIVPVDRFAADVAAGNLPPVTFIDPAMHHWPENDDHPVADLLSGQLFLKAVYDALVANPAVWRKTLLFISYDEHGGFYDHVVAPIAEIRPAQPVATAIAPAAAAPPGSIKASMTIPYGVRVPAFVVSPWVPAGAERSLVLDHCSILKTILARFCGASRPFLSDRVHASLSVDALLTLAEPRLDQVPPSPYVPSPYRIGFPRPPMRFNPVSRKALRSGDADVHDVTAMLARMLGRRLR